MLRISLLLALATAASAGEILVVAPMSPSAPYVQALEGVCEVFGGCPPTVALGLALPLPPNVKVVIALGGLASRINYPRDVAVVTVLTPGYTARRSGIISRVKLTYSPGFFAKSLLRLRPGLRGITLLYANADSGAYAAAVSRAAAALGVDAKAASCRDAEELPALLRSLPARDAVWIAPDPTLVTPTAFDAAREYALGLGETFFAPAPGLASRGAEPGLAPSFQAAGRRAAQAARDILSGAAVAEDLYPDPEDAPGPNLLVVSTKTPSSGAR